MKEKNMRLLAAKHNDWIDIVKSFGLDRETAEDLVQEMYIKIQLAIENKGLDISYGDHDINYYYIFKTLRSLFLDLKRKGKNVIRVPLDNIKDMESDVDYTEKYNQIKVELNKMYWYDKKVFELVNNGLSIAELSRKTGIAYYSLYNTYKKVKEKLKKIL